MGTFVKIELKTKTDSNIEKKNNALKKLGIETYFMSEKDFKDWADDINTNPDSDQTHLKPITVEEVKQRFSYIARTGVLMFDVAFSRTSQEQAIKYAEFIYKHKKSIMSIENADEFTSRFVLPMEHIRAIIDLKKTEKEEFVKLPKDKQYIPDLQSGLMLCKSFSPTPFWVVFGNVDKPTFLKEKIYEDDLYNNIYRDKKGLAYMLLPLIPISNKQMEFANQVYDRAFDMGLRESPNYFLPLIYGFELTNLYKVSDSFKESYTQDEILERFEHVLKHTISTYPYNQPNGIVYRDREKRFKATSKPTAQVMSLIGLLNALLISIDDKKVVAETMSNTLDKIFKAFEFNND